jgi:hypothetical protein
MKLRQAICWERQTQAEKKMAERKIYRALGFIFFSPIFLSETSFFSKAHFLAFISLRGSDLVDSCGVHFRRHQVATAPYTVPRV